MQYMVGIVVGTILGGMVLEWRGLLLGAVLGWMAVRQSRLARRLEVLEAQREPATDSHATQSAASEREEPLADISEPYIEPAEPAASAPVSTPEPVSRSWVSESAAPTSTEPDLFTHARDWLMGGNTAVRVGVIVLFFGVSFLLKYAVEHSLLPIELRLAGAAAGGIALLFIGWRLRENRAGYALTLQGGGIGVLYLTVFAGLRLYQLIPAGAAFALLVGMVLCSALLALLQSSLALAVLGVTGGFLAPILTSTGSGNHVMLFSYYALLNAGILFISWHRAWRVLNVVGFAFTFIIGALWGYKNYQPEFFASVEPFLILFVLMYVAIAVLFALRQTPELRGMVDGTLVFGVPIVGALLQAALVRNMPFGLAWSALATGFFYLALASVLWRRAAAGLRLLVEAFLALGVIFASLAIPLALDGRWTAAAWAVEGAGILWIGVRQARTGARAFGLLLIFAAGFFFLSDREAPGALAVVNAHYVGTLLIALAALFAGQLLHAARERLPESEPVLPFMLLVWGLLWWYGGGLREIERHLSSIWVPAASGVFIVLSCLAAEMLGRARQWPALRQSAVLLLPALALYLLFGLTFENHLFAQAGYSVWLAGFAVFYLLAQRQQSEKAMLFPGVQHTLIFLLLATVATLELAWQLHQLVPEGRDWERLAWLAVPAALLALAMLEPARWPVSLAPRAYRIYAALPIVAATLLLVLHTSAKSAGDPAPLGYLPLINPLELATLFLALILARWLVMLRMDDSAELRELWPMLLGAVLLTAFLFLNTVLFRALHHYAGIAWQAEAMFRSVLVQAAVSIFWSSLALILVIFATRLRQRPVWMAGAVLLGAVVLKLFVIDLANTGTVARIVSFIGVGVLLLIIGYLAPVPPRIVTQENAK